MRFSPTSGNVVVVDWHTIAIANDVAFEAGLRLQHLIDGGDVALLTSDSDVGARRARVELVRVWAQSRPLGDSDRLRGNFVFLWSGGLGLVAPSSRTNGPRGAFALVATNSRGRTRSGIGARHDAIRMRARWNGMRALIYLF